MAKIDGTDEYICDDCGGRFELVRSDEDAEAEALTLFGIEDAASDPEIAILCDECWLSLIGGWGLCEC